MKYGAKFNLLILLICIALCGCANQTSKPSEDSTAKIRKSEFHQLDIFDRQPIDMTGYVKRVENFTIIFDPSASMTEPYRPSYECVACHIDFQNPVSAENHGVKYGGDEFKTKDNMVYGMDCHRCHENSFHDKFKFAKDLTRAINQSIPNTDYKGTLRTFGSPAYANFHYGLMQKDNTKIVTYDKAEYDLALEKIFEAEGVSPLAPTLEALERDWFEREGDIAVIVISDGKDMGNKEVIAARELKKKFGARICIYTILIGNDPFGRGILERIAQSGKCGLAINGDHLLDGANLEKFVRTVFLERARFPAGGDADGDGVPDFCDHCPGSNVGQKVDQNGCWDLVLPADVLFDFDKSNLKPRGILALDQVAAMLNKNPSLDLHIGGHTDNFGSMAYNIALSKRRAKAGYDYLVSKGVDSNRLTMSWHSFTMPVATNKTASGRAQNRRLEFKFKKRM